MSLAAVSVRRPVGAGMIAIATIGLGLVSYSSLRVDLLPPIEIPKLTVETSLPGASAEQTEEAITRPIETTVGAIEGVSRVTSTTHDGISLVTGDLEYGSDVPLAAIELRDKLDQLRDVLPKESMRPIIHRTDPSTAPIIQVGVAWSEWNARHPDSLLELRDFVAAVVKKRLEQLEGVARASVIGGTERQITVVADVDRLRSFGVPLEAIAHAIQSSNVNVSAGTVRMGGYVYPLRATGKLAGARDIARISLGQTASGRGIRVADVAAVRMSTARGETTSWLNGDEIVAVHIHKESGANTVDVSLRVGKALAMLRREYPGAEFTVVSDHAGVIQAAAGEVKWSIVVGAALAAGVLLVVLREGRFPAIIAATILVSLLLTIVAMRLLGISLNLMSLAGLAIAVGMLGDNAMVVIENVQRRFGRSCSPPEAAVKGTEELSGALTASTLTNVAIFLPIIAVGGIARELFSSLAMTMSVALIASLLVALTMVPALLASTVPVRAIVGGARAARDDLAGWSRVRGAVRLYLLWALRRPGTVLLAAALLFVASLGVALVLPGDMVPRLTVSGLQVRVAIPSDYQGAQVTRFAAALERQIQSLPSVEMVYMEAGVTARMPGLQGGAPSNELAMLVRLRDADAITRTMADIRRLLIVEAHRLAGLRWFVEPEETLLEQVLRPERDDIFISISGPVASIRDSLARAVGSLLRATEGVVDVRLSDAAASEEALFTVDPDVLQHYGVRVEEVVAEVRRAIGGEHATDLIEFDRRTAVRVLLTGQEPPSAERVLSSSVIVHGHPISLRRLVTCELHTVPAAIVREDYQRVASAKANISSRFLESVAEDLEKLVGDLHVPAGYRVAVGGENSAVARSLKTMLLVVILSCGAVYLILGVQYESFVYPLVILLTGPLSLIGAMFAVVITGGGFTLFSVLGIVIMIGAVDNDAVIVVDVISSLRKTGVGGRDAIVEGVLHRLRAIVMTSATSVLGVAPLFFSAGASSKALSSMSAPLVGGLISSTLASIMVVPVVFSLIERWRTRWRGE